MAGTAMNGTSLCIRIYLTKLDYRNAAQVQTVSR